MTGKAGTPLYRKDFFLAAVPLVIVITLLVYLNVLGAGFVNVDDPDYVLNNPLIRQIDANTVTSAFSGAHLGWWMPLTWLSLSIDYHFWGLNPLGYHLTNILLHALNAGLTALIAGRVIMLVGLDEEDGETQYRYFVAVVLAALLWSLHPLRVESVAWVTERKDVLNGLFSLGALYCYLVYSGLREEKKGYAWSCYALSLLLFFLSLMAKSVSVVLPLILLTLDRYLLGRLRSGNMLPVLLEKVPFLAGSIVLTVATLVLADQQQYLVSYDAFPLTQRLAVSGNAIWEYCRMLVLPLNLSPFNVIPDPVPPVYAIKAVMVTIAIILAIRSRRLPLAKACLLCFLLPLLPVLAFFQNGDQAFADRFTYLPSLAPLIAASLLLSRFSFRYKRVGKCAVLVALPIGVLLLLTVASLRMMTVWQSSETFWTRVIDVNPTAISHKERGRYYHYVGRYSAAVGDFTIALEMLPETLKPYQYNFYAFRGESLRKAGHLADSVNDFSIAISFFPHPAYYYHRGLALQALGRSSEANEDFRRSGAERAPIIWFNTAIQQ